jgi:hypothetical protein
MTIELIDHCKLTVYHICRGTDVVTIMMLKFIQNLGATRTLRSLIIPTPVNWKFFHQDAISPVVSVPVVTRDVQVEVPLSTLADAVTVQDVNSRSRRCVYDLAATLYIKVNADFNDSVPARRSIRNVYEWFQWAGMTSWRHPGFSFAYLQTQNVCSCL